ncbi:MAG TPA: hypothetical protein VME46_16910 [Acidimicrobiales bacterium]|nr:hypothetical protein [Acidimicrobiales bacterium]
MESLGATWLSWRTSCTLTLCLRLQRVSTSRGTVGGAAVRLRGRIGPRGGQVRGTWAGVAINWRLSDMLGQNPPRSAGTIKGRIGDGAVNLEGEFQLAPRYLFEQADIAGDLAGQAFTAKLALAESGPGSNSAVVAEGSVGEEPFELFAAPRDDVPGAVVRGSLGGRPVALDATHDDPTAVRVVGQYAGRLPLLALIVGVVVHFV